MQIYGVIHMTQLPRVSKRSGVDAFLVMDMLRSANQLEGAGNDIVHMAAGQPGTGAPKSVIEAAKAALDSEKLGYTESLGMPVLRERIAAYYQEKYGVSLNSERVVVTTGSSGSFVLTFLAAFEAGDKVALPTPGYPAYRNILNALGVATPAIQTIAANRWVPGLSDIDDLMASGPLHGLLMASPNNPTGTMIRPDALKALVEKCHQLGLWLISDEIYHGLNYEMGAASALQFTDEAIIINSFSKYFCMTGWRIGWMIVPERLVRPLEKLSQSLFISAPTLSQIAGVAAFDATEELEQRKQIYAANRAILLQKLPLIGLDDFLPVDGAFYLYADVRKFTNDSFAFAQKMLSEIGVSVTPGADFDHDRGAQFIRLSFAGSTDSVEQAIERLGNWLK
jgi:aspartate/methionine/tyrosine aminotransferase